jgi:hypothetical protein
MITRANIEVDLNRWFSGQNSTQTGGEKFEGVVIFQRKKKVLRGPNRLGVAAGSWYKAQWEAKGNSLKMPYTSQPSIAWSGAFAIGFAATKEEAIQLLFGE